MQEENKQQLIVDNQNLVRYCVSGFGVTPYSEEYEDIVSIGTVGLIKAAKTFDRAKEIKFSTYAATCIKNEINMYYRKAWKHKIYVPLDAAINAECEDKEICLIDTFVDDTTDFIETMKFKENFVEIMDVILNYLKARERLVMFYRMGKLTQVEIGEKLHTSQVPVSRAFNRAKSKVQEAMKYQFHFEKAFDISKEGVYYRIVFVPKNFAEFKEKFQEINVEKALPGFQIIYNQERVTIQLIAEPEYCILTAQVLQRIEELGIELLEHA